MADERVINLDKVQKVLEMVAENRDLLRGVNSEFDKFFAGLGIELNKEEKAYVISQLTHSGGRALPAS